MQYDTAREEIEHDKEPEGNGEICIKGNWDHWTCQVWLSCNRARPISGQGKRVLHL
jgi:hypothetical protein